MDIEDRGTHEQAMLEQAQRQTTALEALRNFALIVLAIGAIGLLLGLIAVFG